MYPRLIAAIPPAVRSKTSRGLLGISDIRRLRSHHTIIGSGSKQRNITISRTGTRSESSLTIAEETLKNTVARIILPTPDFKTERNP